MALGATLAALVFLTAGPAPAQGGKFIGAWLILNDPVGQSKLGGKTTGYSCTFMAEVAGNKARYMGTVVALKDGRFRLALTMDPGDGREQHSVLICDGNRVVTYQVENGQLVSRSGGDAPGKAYLVFTTVFFRGGGIAAFASFRDKPDKLTADKLKLDMVTDDKADKVGDIAARLIEYKATNKEKETTIVGKLWLDQKQELPLKRILDLSAPGKDAARLTETNSDWQLNPKVNDDDFKHPAK
jgi:outer membrane lipoprotein-sorting protein